MTDESRDPEENEVSEDEKTREEEREAEGGPVARPAAFIQERLAALGLN